MPTDLSDKMRALADRVDATIAADLRAKADAFDAATEAHYAEGGGQETAKIMIGAWSRARRLYCKVSGESLI